MKPKSIVICLIPKRCQEFARLVMSLGVWGRQQMDENGGNDSAQVVLPDSSMDQTELLKYRNTIEQYI